jgi:hypothetical protein
MTKKTGIIPSATEEDRNDLAVLLTMRFGEIPREVLSAILEIDDFTQIDHLILVAANAATFSEFVRELSQPGVRIGGSNPSSESKSDRARRSRET